MVDLRGKLTCYIRSLTRSSMEATKIFESNRIGSLVAISLIKTTISLKNLLKALLNTVGIPVVSPRSRFTDDQLANGLGGFANVSVQLADVS